MLILVKHFEALRWEVELEYKEAVNGIEMGEGETSGKKTETPSDVNTDEKWKA